ncbi:diguanylate cyclase (GGDEF)-like protein/PAS domain S-box-containing protein [Desulfohalotomaculum tongense]|uniref:sensor domain-containing diguanylate cyclase n=1 Tax=Desulforadius tongensis TaxID=1216062 RepID=UPI001956865F|nr:PAS domain S-box protein [Desulforadius tongensis]MBM7855959.1 diguanylate cyclase (GGDEF)-like protein/PAS domain S-box-containing protein [Desulforadius tongensis]
MLNNPVMKLVQHLSLSYEISLAIGQSLDLKEMLGNIIKTIVRKTSAHRGFVWIVKENIEYVTGAGFGVKNYKPNNTAAVLAENLPEILQQEITVIGDDNPKFGPLCYYRTGREKEIILISINNSIIFHLVFGRQGVAGEGVANVIKGLGPQIANAVSACINYQKVLAFEQKEKNRLKDALYHSEKRYRLLTEKALVGIFLIQDKKLRYVNPKLAQIFGYTVDEMVNKMDFDKLITEKDKPVVNNKLENIMAGKELDASIVFSAYRKDGCVVFCECMGTKTEHNGRPAIVGTLTDITKRRQAEEKLRHLATHDSLTGIHNRAYAVSACINYQKVLAFEQKEKNRLKDALYHSEKRYRLLTEKALVGIFLIQDKKLRYVNPKLAQIFGYTVDEMVNKMDFDKLITEKDKPVVNNKLENIMAGKELDASIVFSAYRKDGCVVFCECMGTKTEHNGRPAIVGTLTDITKRRQAEEKLRHLATHDSLTGIHNRAYLEQVLNSLKDDSKSFPLAIIFCDVDRLKSINDSYGHKMGDKVLKQAAAILQRCLRKDDILTRYGGDEFVAILPNTTGETVETLIQKINEAVNRYNETGTEVPISLSVGWEMAESFQRLKDAFTTADYNMYACKSGTKKPKHV